MDMKYGGDGKLLYLQRAPMAVFEQIGTPLSKRYCALGGSRCTQNTVKKNWCLITLANGFCDSR